jgi:hypothetical protein
LQGGYQTVSLKTITTFGQFTLEGMPMDLQLECHEETIGFFHGEFDRKFPNLSRNRFRRPARRGFCDLYHQGKLTYIDIWNALNQHYKKFKNGTYYPNWERHYIQKGEPIFVPIFQCGNYCNIGLPCGGRR